MKKLLLSLFAIISTFFIIQNVNAAAYNFNNLKLTDDVSGASGFWTTNSPGFYFNTSGYRTIDFETDNVGTLLNSVNYQYGFISYCSYDNIYETYRQNGNYSEEMQMFDTYVKSSIYNSSIPCTIKYITWKFKYNCGANGTNCFAAPRFKFYGDVSDYSLRSYGFTKEPLQIDTTNGQILNQNATIISQNQTIINNSDNIKSTTEDIKGSLNDDSIDTSQSDSFFDGFNNEDNLLTSVVLFPIQILNNVDATCTPLTLPFESDKMKANDYSLPCGDTLFWNKPKVAEFKKFWNFIVGAPIIYGCLLWSFKTIQKLKNPFDNEVEMIEL